MFWLHEGSFPKKPLTKPKPLQMYCKNMLKNKNFIIAEKGLEKKQPSIHRWKLSEYYSRPRVKFDAVNAIRRWHASLAT